VRKIARSYNRPQQHNRMRSLIPSLRRATAMA